MMLREATQAELLAQADYLGSSAYYWQTGIVSVLAAFLLYILTPGPGSIW